MDLKLVPASGREKMALNFLKRNKKSRKGTRTHSNRSEKNKSNKNSEACVEDIFRISLKESVPEQPVCEINKEEIQESKKEIIEKVEIEKGPESLDYVEDTLSGNIAEQNWDKGKGRIEKLLNDISDLLNSDDLVKQRIDTKKESTINNKNISKRQDSAGQSLSEQNSVSKKDVSKLPLDIQELHNVAAMAKRLSARSKLKRH